MPLLVGFSLLLLYAVVKPNTCMFFLRRGVSSFLQFRVIKSVAKGHFRIITLLFAVFLLPSRSFCLRIKDLAIVKLNWIWKVMGASQANKHSSRVGKGGFINAISCTCSISLRAVFQKHFHFTITKPKETKAKFIFLESKFFGKDFNIMAALARHDLHIGHK